MDTLSFPVDRTLLNPKFEGYKLGLGAESDVRTFPVPYPLKAVDGLASQLSFNELQFRLKHNHLCVGENRKAYYIDAENRVIEVGLEASPAFAVVARLPETVSTAPAEQSIIKSTRSGHLVVSDGRGVFYLISAGKINRTFELVLAGGVTPFVLIESASTDAQTILNLVAVPTKDASGTHTVFDYFCVELALEPTSSDTSGVKIYPWHVRGSELPHYVLSDGPSRTFAVGTRSSLYLDDGEPETSGAFPGETSGAPLREDTIVVDTHQPAVAPGTIDAETSPSKPLYSWTQDSDSITLAIPLRSDTPMSSIKVNFSREFLTVLIGSNLALGQTALFSISHKKLWDVIVPTSSLWTFDREGEGRTASYGVLTLHLEKGHPGTKWPDVFTPTLVALPEDADPKSVYEYQLEHVPETLDPSELAKVTEELEQWTESYIAGNTADAPRSTLMGDELDAQIDSESGLPVVMTWIRVADEKPELVRPHPGIVHSLMSLHVPTVYDTPLRNSITIKHDVDALLYQPPATATARWDHIGSFYALSFVLASKRDVQFVFHVGRDIVLAFDSPSSSKGWGGNIFAYYSTTTNVSQQKVFRVGSPTSGPLMGVVGLGPRQIGVLCQNELSVIDL